MAEISYNHLHEVALISFSKKKWFQLPLTHEWVRLKGQLCIFALCRSVWKFHKRKQEVRCGFALSFAFIHICTEVLQKKKKKRNCPPFFRLKNYVLVVEFIMHTMASVVTSGCLQRACFQYECVAFFCVSQINALIFNIPAQ